MYQRSFRIDRSVAALLSLFAGFVGAEEKSSKLEEVVVVASKIERPLYRVASQVTQLHRDDLLLQQIQQFGEIARYEAALDTEYSGSRFGTTGVSVRSIGGNRVAIELDGVPLPQHFAIGEFANTSRTLIDPAIVERVEVLRGAASSLYGSDAIGGVIAVTSIDPSNLVEPGALTYLGGGANHRSMDDSDAGYITYAMQGAHAGLQVTGSYREGEEPDSRSETVPADRVDYSEAGVFAKAIVDLDDDTSLRFVADTYARDASSDLRAVLGYGRQYSSTVELYGEDSQERRRISAELVDESTVSLDLASVLAFYQDSETGQETSDYRASAGVTDTLIERAFSFDQSQYGVEAKIRKDLELGSTFNVIVAGIEWEREELIEARDGTNTDLVSGAVSKVLPPGELLPQRDLPKSETQSIGIYVQDEIQLADWTLIPALRWDSFELDASTDALLGDPDRLTDLDDDQLSAKLGLTYRINDSTTAFAHYAEGFRAPPAEDVNLYLDYSGFVTVRALPNPDLEPEESTNYEVGLRFTGASSALSLSAYRSDYDNFIESRVNIGVDPSDGALLFQSRNVSNARIDGFEVEMSQELAQLSDALTEWSMDISFHSARGEDVDTSLPINMVNPPKGVFGIHWQRYQPLSASLRATHYREQTRTDQSDETFFVAPAATIVDLMGRWSVTSNIEFFAGLYNLGDKRYWRYGDVRVFAPDDPRVDAFARPGRTFAVSVHLGRQN